MQVVERLDAIDWGDTSGDDLTAEYQNYLLRVEKMDKGRWWWMVYLRGKPLTIDIPYESSKARAMGICEGVVLGQQLRLDRRKNISEEKKERNEKIFDEQIAHKVDNTKYDSKTGKYSFTKKGWGDMEFAPKANTLILKKDGMYIKPGIRFIFTHILKDMNKP